MTLRLHPAWLGLSLVAALWFGPSQVWAQEPLGQGANPSENRVETRVDCDSKPTPARVQRTYHGRRYPQDTQWKIPLQLIAGYAVGLVAAGFAVSYAESEIARDRSPPDTTTQYVDVASGFGEAVSIISTMFLAGTAATALISPLPIWAIGNLGNEQSSLGMTYIGSLAGLLVPFIGSPIGATIANRSSRTYKYECFDIEPGAVESAAAARTPFRLRLFEPDIRPMRGQWRYGLNFLIVSI